MLVFGPVPSRRLGKSLGINNIPPKICSYSCIYCQVGLTTKKETERRSFYGTEEIVKQVENKLQGADKSGIDYLTFVTDGEPTLDCDLGNTIRTLKKFGVRIAVITNSSLLWREDVREELKEVDWVSVKVDSVVEGDWKRINAPARSLDLDDILAGIRKFSEGYKGKLVTETMLVKGVNDGEEALEKTARFLSEIKPDTAYISIPTRPPAVKNVEPAGEETIARAYGIYSSMLDNVEYLIGYEGDSFSSTGDAETDILSITAVHPMRKEAVEKLLAEAGATWETVEKMISEEKIKEVDYHGNKFYIRRFK